MALDTPGLGPLPDDADFYPLPFMQVPRRTLLVKGIARSRLHYEVLGPDLFGGLDAVRG